MRVLDPQSALLTTSEVHQFLSQNPPRPPPRKIGSYKQVNLKDYERLRDDFEHYVTNTVPFIARYPPPETFIKNVVPRLHAFGLTKTEALGLINLGLGLPRGQQQQQNADEDDQAQDVNGEGDNNDDVDDHAPADGVDGQIPAEGEEQPEPDDRQFLSLVIEELEERFPGEEGEAQVQQILETMREEYNRAHAAHASANGDTKN
ncbi:uncharacterized protein Z520_04609 [Fonsecaea multimorphosa CBS 102226]|uniref:Uncharacterized protein n=1 Tax=Fonsecaea multimorphosa CBS 102226 TaxID=1442371 RepID=A0A0D2ISN7_9EURO|nr:uncharacterized protein Z520_04609 [Fonsecaea multimorphosa CBS 102226]KIX99971.1 hypothetical protein Z520_04609 [Fonsecaea multimorphosa CBS 102226]OAL26185.1 hypothetical protein AYO22_04363 [Fonsecaea multimorphosa]